MERFIRRNLYRLGANKEKNITLNSDGATCIWGRIHSILTNSKVGSRVVVTQVLDVSHVVDIWAKGFSL